MAISTRDIITSTMVKPRWRRKLMEVPLELMLRFLLIISIILDCGSLILRSETNYSQFMTKKVRRELPHSHDKLPFIRGEALIVGNAPGNCQLNAARTGGGIAFIIALCARLNAGKKAASNEAAFDRTGISLRATAPGLCPRWPHKEYLRSRYLR